MSRVSYFSFGIIGLALLMIAGTCITFSCGSGNGYYRPDTFPSRYPRIFLWAWERPEDLAFLDPRKTGVAVLAKTLTIRNEHIISRPRLQPIRLPSGVAALAVIRIETEELSPTFELLDKTIDEILETVRSTPAAGLQIDFDALESERTFYRDMLAVLKEKLPPDILLSITALASWCYYDDWISDLPVDEAVPMLFRMGRDGETIKRYLDMGRDFRVATARFSVGVSLDEPFIRVPQKRRVYIFNPLPWTEESAERALQLASELQ
jgi:hypothetical protein